MDRPRLAERAARRQADPGQVRAAANAAREAYRHGGDSLAAYQAFAGEALAHSAAAAKAALTAGYSMGPLHGVRVSVKDIYGASGWPIYAGSPHPLPASWQRDGALVQALKAQFALLTGKTRTVEFAYGGLGPNAHWPCPRNPWDSTTHRVPGGSSAGAPVSLWDGTAELAVGTDTAGSVRVPAAMNGLAGLKTSKGRWPTDGIVPLCPSFDTPGLMAPTVADLADGFAALDGPLAGGRPGRAPAPADLAGLRIGLCDQVVWDDLSPGVGEAVTAALGELDRHGARREKLDLPEAEEAITLFKTKGGLTPPEIYAFLQAELPGWLETLDPRVSERIYGGYDIPAWQYRRRVVRFGELAQSAARQLDAVDVLATPTVALTPPPVEAVADKQAYGPANLLALRNTAVGNCLNLCGVTLPVGLDGAGMPVGLQLLAPPWREERLLAIAQGIEAALGTGADRLGRPPLAVAP